MNDDVKSAVAEFFGTFTLVFIGAAAGALAGPDGSNAGIVGVALAHGIALAVIIYAWGSISGAHVNPAVTLGVAVAGRIPWPKAVAYWIAQFLGAAVAALLLKYLIGAEGGLGSTIGRFTQGAAADPTKVVIVEAVLTFFLVSAVFASGIANRNGNLAGLAIGLVLTMDILAGGALTGASMNPARSFGPALAMGDFTYFWMYLVGPAIGGMIAALVYDRLFMPAESKPPIKVANQSKKR